MDLTGGRVPLTSLEVLAHWSAKTGAAVLAGTHTPIRTQSARRKYSALGISEGAVAVRLVRARQALASMLSETSGSQQEQ